MDTKLRKREMSLLSLSPADAPERKKMRALGGGEDLGAAALFSWERPFLNA